MELKHFLKEQRKLKRLTQNDLSTILDIAPSTVSAWERGANRPTMDKITVMSELFEVPISKFFEEGFRDTQIIKIPILGTITCGDPILAEENFEGYREEVSDLVPSGNVFYLRAKGESMSPTIPNGSFVLIREQSEVENGEIAAVLVNGNEEATLKRVKRQGEIVMLLADNPQFPPYIITEENPAKIIGKAMRFSMDL